MSLSFDSARLRDPAITEDHEAWREQVSRFFDKEIYPNVDAWDEQVFLPPELWGDASGVYASA